jgi:predicted Rdx family selenoprotein
MIDTDLIVKLLREHGHTVESVFHVPENAGEYEFSVDGNLLTLAETRELLEREDDGEVPSVQSIVDRDHLPSWER